MKNKIYSNYGKILLMLLVTLLLANCSDDDENPNPDPTKSSAIPSNLVGQWERTFERNGSTGTAVLEITSDGHLNSYEIGDHQIMEEWYSNLPSGVTYKFWSDPPQPITAVTDSTFSVGKTSGTAHIVNNDTGNEVVSWDIGSIEQEITYEIADNGNTLILMDGNTGVEFSKL